MKNQNINILNFVAVDMELLNSSTTSVCEIGMVRYQNGIEMETFHSLLKPIGNLEKGLWQERNLKHISIEDLEKAPTFKDIYEEIKSFIGDNLIVCHSTGADLNYLYNLESAFGLTGLCSMPHADTQKMAMRHFQFLPSSKLEYCYELVTGKKQKEKHHALPDARACATVYMTLMEQLKPEDFIETLPYIPKKEQPKKNINTECVPIGELPIDDHILAQFNFQGKSVKMSGISDEEKAYAKKVLQSKGANTPTGNPTTNTDAFIVGKAIGPSKKKAAIEQKEKRPDSFFIFTIDSFLALYPL